jgi:hypothetical protein
MRLKIGNAMRNIPFVRKGFLLHADLLGNGMRCRWGKITAPTP